MHIENYRGKVMGCWLGKAAGGTLGQTYEGMFCGCLVIADAQIHGTIEKSVNNRRINICASHVVSKSSGYFKYKWLENSIRTTINKYLKIKH